MRALVIVVLVLAGCSSRPIGGVGGSGGGGGAGGNGGGGGGASEVDAGSGGGGPDSGTIACGGAPTQWVWSAVNMPAMKGDFPLDLNGDGKPDNQLAIVDGASRAQGLDAQVAADDALATGASITLMTAALGADGCASTSVQAGAAASRPDYSGSGSFTVDGASVPGRFGGALVNTVFTSQPEPSVTRLPTTVMLRLPLTAAFGATVPVLVPVIGARLRYQQRGGAIMSGQLNGAIREQDVQATIIPALATALDAQAHSGTSQAMTVLSLFDTGGKGGGACAPYCHGSDGSCGVPNNGNIETCEVATNSIVQNMLAPDVQMFDAVGNYRPNPANSVKDCVSIGLGFSAARASF